MRRISKIILLIGVYTMTSEAFNQYFTLLGLSKGGIEIDMIASFLFSTVGTVGETIVMFALPTLFLGMAHLASQELDSTTARQVMYFFLVLTLLLGVSTTYAAINDYNTLHATHQI